MRNILTLTTVVAVLLFSCKPSGPDAKLKNIESLEDKIYNSDLGNTASTDDMEELSALYKDYAANHAKDNAPEYLFKAAEVEKSLGNYDESLDLFDQIVKKHPDHEKAPMALFYRGFIYENDLADLNAANKCYHEFTQAYPNHELIDDVQFSIKNLGKPIDQIIHDFERNEKKEQQKEKPPVKFEES